MKDTMKDTGKLLTELTKEFPKGEVQYKLQVQAENGDLYVPYVDARTVMTRLDAVLGPDGWTDSYKVLADRVVDGVRLVEVECALSIRVGDEWITKCDVGEGDTMKAAFSDALKRAAVKFGVGRYLYRLEKRWEEKGGAPRRDGGARPHREGQEEDGSDLATEAQLKAIGAIGRKLGFSRESLRDYVVGIVGRDLVSSKELTKAEASKVIEQLKEDEKEFDGTNSVF